MNDDMHVLTGSYVLDALSAAEREDFERHLQRCPSCAAEVRGLRETAARLAMAKQARPPAQLEQRVLSATYRTRQLPPLGSERFRLASRRAVMTRLFSVRKVRAWAHPHPKGYRLQWSPRLIGAVAAASVVVAVGLGLTQVSTQHRLDSVQASAAAIARVVQAPDARLETMRTRVGGIVTVVYSGERGAAVITSTGMSALPSGRVYQAWVMSPAGAHSVSAHSAGLISQPGLASLLASGVRSGDRIGITVEPAGGTSRPTTKPVLIMPLTA